MRFCIRFVYDFYVVDIWFVCGYMQCMWLLYFSMRFHAFLCIFYATFIWLCAQNMHSKYAPVPFRIQGHIFDSLSGKLMLKKSDGKDSFTVFLWSKKGTISIWRRETAGNRSLDMF